MGHHIFIEDGRDEYSQFLTRIFDKISTLTVDGHVYNDSTIREMLNELIHDLLVLRSKI